MAEVSTAKLAAGSIQIESIKIKSEITNDEIDLKTIVWELNIYESINKPFVTADLMIGDALSLTSVLPIVGQETVEIKFKTPDFAVKKKIDLKLRVARVREYTRTNQRTSQYILELASEQYFSDINSKISKAFVNLKISDMVKNIGKFFLQIKDSRPIYAEETDGERTIVIPNMFPTRAIEFLSKEAKSARYKASNFIFFENCDGFFFAPIDRLILLPYPSLRNPTTPTDSSLPNQISPEIGGGYNSGTDSTYIDYYYATDKDFNKGGAEAGEWRGGTESKKPFELQKMNGFRFTSLFNNDMTTIKGGFEVNYMYLDPSVSLFEQRKYNYFDDFDDLEHTTSKSEGHLLTKENQNIGGQGEAHQIFTMTNKESESDPLFKDQKVDFLHLNAGSLGLLEDIVVDVDIPGDSDRRAGDIVRLQFPEYGATDDVKGKLNEFISGDYLVVAVRHHYNAENGYRCYLQCIKNAYEKDLSSMDKKNITDPEDGTAEDNGLGGSNGVPSSGTISGNDPALTNTNSFGGPR